MTPRNRLLVVKGVFGIGLYFRFFADFQFFFIMNWKNKTVKYFEDVGKCYVISIGSISFKLFDY